MSDIVFSKKYAAQKFDELYRARWKSQGKTAEDFIKAIKACLPDAKCDHRYVTRWRYGSLTLDGMYLEHISRILGVDSSVFYMRMPEHDEKYEYLEKYADGLEGSLENIAMENFGIDLTLLKGLRNIIPDFDKQFPLFAPLHYYGAEDPNHKPYQRSVPAEAVETSKGKGLFQITKDGKTYFLTKYDMKVIRAAQISIRENIIKFFEKRRAEYDEAEAKANATFWEKNIEINPDYDEDKTLWKTYVLSDDELQAIDKAGIYTRKEEKRFRLPPEGTPLYTDDTETEDQENGNH
ncbi:MAG: hypothetical protein IK140_02085 [Clostridia bacterium]|nr:hypothetical protein [Clostridia bacterium]